LIFINMMSLMRWLRYSSWITAINKTGWMYATAEVAHHFSLFVLVGTTVLVDLRVLEVTARSESVAQVADQFFPWTCTL
jgi:hypothetical protein